MVWRVICAACWRESYLPVGRAAFRAIAEKALLVSFVRSFEIGLLKYLLNTLDLYFSQTF